MESLWLAGLLNDLQASENTCVLKKIQDGQLPEELTSAGHTQRKRDNKKMTKVLGPEAGRYHWESRLRTCRQDAQEKQKEK